MAKHDLGDIELIRTRLECWLQNHLTDAQDLVLGELSFPEESGESSVTLILNAETRGATHRYICRMKPRDSQVFTEHDLPLQYNLMKLAAANGIPVPPLLGFEPDESFLGSDFYIMGFVDGQIATDNPPYVFGSWVTQLSDSERATQWRNGLKTLSRIHCINIAESNVPGIPESALDAAPAQHEIDKFRALMTPEVEQRLPAVVLRAVAYVADNAPPDGPRRLCWGDSRPGNVIWKDLKPSAVIDWEMASIGDPMQDVSWWYWIDYINSLGLGVPRLGGLPSLDTIYQQWQDLTGLPILHRDYYDLFSIVRFAIILEKKFLSLEKAGIGTIENYSLPFVEQQLLKCQSQ